MRLIPIECVKPNTIIGKTLYDIDGKVLLKSGVSLTEILISKIRDMHIFSIYIIDEYSSEEIEDIIKPELRQKTIAAIKEAFSNINRITLADKFAKKDSSYFDEIQNLVEDLIEDVLNNKNVSIPLVDIRSMSNYIYSHSVNVAVISLILGIALKLSRKELNELCIGSLLHDIGKSFIPKDIIMKKSALTSEEEEILKQHPNLGYKYLSEYYELNPNSKMIVLQHHERPDGLGYPNRLDDDKINKLSKIVSIANYYDFLTSGSPNLKSLFPSDVLEYLMCNAGKVFDYDMVNIFCKIVVPFSKGTLVDLSNGDIAIVQETVPNFPLRPIVKILKSTNTDTIGNEINLIEAVSIVITSIRYEV